MSPAARARAKAGMIAPVRRPRLTIREVEVLVFALAHVQGTAPDPLARATAYTKLLQLRDILQQGDRLDKS